MLLVRYWQLTLIIAVLLAFGGYTAYIYNKGQSQAEAKSAIIQIKHEKKVKETFREIENKSPDRDDPYAMAEFLLSHAVSK